MHRPQRLRSVVDGRRIVLALGVLYVALAVAHPFAPFVAAASAATYLVVGILTGAAGLVLLVVGYCLPRLDVRPDVYSVVARWCLRGIGAMVVLLGLVAVVGVLRDPVQNVLILTGIGAVAGVVAGVHDGRATSRQRELEETVEQLERANERLSQFTYATSHDLQEPLRMVSSYLQLLDSRYGNDLDEEAREYLDFAVGGADRMRAMVASLHEYAQVSPAEAPHERTDAGVVLDDVLDDLEEAIENTDATVTADELPTVTADSRQLSHLFRNLLSNALRFSGDETPQVHVSATRVDVDGQPVDADEPSDDGGGQPVDAGGPSDEAGGVSTGADGGTIYADEPGGRSGDQDDHLASASPEDEWRFAVTDHGLGIDPEYQDQLFGPFEQFHASDGPGQEAGGTGLALCERIVERHGGDIWVESEPGEGSTFYFTLPVAPMDRAERPLDPPAVE